MKRLLIILFSLINIICFADDANYYVDNTGTGDTLSTLTEVNALLLNPDDTVFFKRGCTWRDDLNITRSGTAGHYIVFTSYGTGDKPQILGSIQAITWTDCTGNVWKSATSVSDPWGGSYTAQILFIESDDSTKYGDHKTDTASLVEEYDWTWNSNTLYVYAASDPDARYTKIEAPQSDIAVITNNEQYIEFYNINILYWRRFGIFTEYPNTDLHGFIVDSCEIGFIGEGNEVSYGISVQHSDFIVRNCNIHHVGRRGISFNSYGSGYTIEDILIEDNIFSNGNHTTGLDMSIGSGGYTQSIDTVVVRNNLFYEDEYESIHASNLIFLQNYNVGGTLSNVWIYNNIFMYPTGQSVLCEVIDNLYVYNNTFYGSNKVITDLSIHFKSTGCTDVILRNNIFYGDAVNTLNDGAYSLYFPAGQDKSEIDADYNLYYQEDALIAIVSLNASTTLYHMNDWIAMKAAMGWETNSPSPADPLFINVTAPIETDSLMIGDSSPADSAGIAVGITYDYRDSVRADVTSIGAFDPNAGEETPPPVMPSIVTTTPVKQYSRLVSVGGSTIGDGGGTISAKGVCYSISSNPTISDTKVSGGTGTADFSVFCPVTANTTYHFRAYCTNAEGTAYGADLSIDMPVHSFSKNAGKIIKNTGKTVIIH